MSRAVQVDRWRYDALKWATYLNDRSGKLLAAALFWAFTCGWGALVLGLDVLAPPGGNNWLLGWAFYLGPLVALVWFGVSGLLSARWLGQMSAQIDQAPEDSAR